MDRSSRSTPPSVDAAVDTAIDIASDAAIDATADAAEPAADRNPDIVPDPTADVAPTKARRQKPPRRKIDNWQGTPIEPGTTHDLTLAIGESYSGMTIGIPIQIRRAPEPGPTVFVTAAIHGNEINGTGAIRQLILDPEFELRRGAVLLAPVLNLLGFDRHSRYLPDRRDLNRSFPGSAGGSLASRMARTIFREIVGRCDYGVDLHTAAIRRTNYPNIRGDLSDPRVRELAEAFGCELLLDGAGPRGSFRREATLAGCPTIVMEGGEVSKVEPAIVAASIRGLYNVFSSLGMLDRERERPASAVTITQSKWLRAERGGFLQFHIQPGDVVRAGDRIATNTTLIGREQSVLVCPFDSVVIGMTTLPAISPGDPVCHLGRLDPDSGAADMTDSRADDAGLETRLSDELGTNVLVVDPEMPEQERTAD